MPMSEESTETRELLQLASDGDLSAIDRLFDRHLPMVKMSIRRRIAPGAQARFDASDVIQVTHHTARQQFADYLVRRPMAFRLWLLKNAQQRLIDFERTHFRASKEPLIEKSHCPTRRR